jgi:hypothetical protein
LALMFANPTLMSLAQYGTKPQRAKSRLRSPALRIEANNRQLVSGRSVPTGREVRRGPMRRNGKDKLDLADIGGEADAATHGASIAWAGRDTKRGDEPHWPARCIKWSHVLSLGTNSADLPETSNDFGRETLV